MNENSSPATFDKTAFDQSLLSNLLEALPFIARMTGGRVQLTDESGVAVLSVDQKGEEIPLASREMSDLAKQAAKRRVAFAVPDSSDGEGNMWAVRVGSCVLVLSGADRAAREAELLSSLESALPLIAKVAGGEAAIFDQEGRFLKAVFPNGKPDMETLGEAYESCYVAMASGRPHVGPSHLIAGAMAVRIPLTRDFGFGFNNSTTVIKGHEMWKEVSKVRTARYTWADIIGESECLRVAIETARKAAGTMSPVCISGESGTGKELFAQAIHNAGTRRDKPFVAVNCAALPPSLIESTLFGYIDGAFTGARKGGQPGLFEQADSGTLLLDEVSEMDLNLQAKLLRVLQEREVVRIGSSKSTPVDVRIISTTNGNLRNLVEAGDFREDLFYRLNVVDVKTPVLRDRKKDIPILTNFFLGRLSYQLNRLITRVGPAAMTRMQEYNWPGNVRNSRIPSSGP